MSGSLQVYHLRRHERRVALSFLYGFRILDRVVELTGNGDYLLRRDTRQRFAASTLIQIHR